MTKTKISVLCALAASVAVAGYYADLLRAAVTFNPIAYGPESLARGRVIYAERCLVCHGERGEGDGSAAAGLGKRPKNLAAMAPPPIFPDGVVAYRIANGGEVMPAWKGILSDNQIWDVLNYVRSLSPRYRSRMP